MKKPIILGVAIVATLALVTAPVSAGAGELVVGKVVVTPDEVVVGGSVVISNEADPGSTCQSASLPAEGSSNSVVDLEVEDPEGALIVDEQVVPDTDGNWSYEVTGLELEGEYTVIAWCEATGNGPQSVPAAFPTFQYADTFFQVVAQSSTPTTASGAAGAGGAGDDGGTGGTTAGTGAVTATPTYTG